MSNIQQLTLNEIDLVSGAAGLGIADQLLSWSSSVENLSGLATLALSAALAVPFQPAQQVKDLTSLRDLSNFVNSLAKGASDVFKTWQSWGL